MLRLFGHFIQIKMLTLLRASDTGLSADQIRTRLGSDVPILTVEHATGCFDADRRAKGGSRPLVRCDRTIWKILV